MPPLFIPLFAGSKTPPSNSANARQPGGISTARKSPIGES
nr:spermidine/putrescine ABC transporter ATP-binding protein [Bacillus cereus]